MDRIGVSLTQRKVPFPESISAEANAALERLVREDGFPVNALYDAPTPDDIAGWQKLRAIADDHYRAVMQQRQPSSASVETLKIGQTIVHVATPVSPSNDRFAYIDLHGGALVFGGGEACRVGTQHQADSLNLCCFGIDYRMPPEHPYPVALDDCLVTYRYVLDRHAPEDIVIGGRSAGGNLAAAMLLKARDEGLPMPSGLVLLSPQLDLTESGDSFAVNQMVDVVLPRSLMNSNLLYANGADLAHPYLSPLFGDLRGFPKTFLQTGTRDLFLSNVVRMHRALRKAGVAVELHIFEGMPHGGFGGSTPEDAELAVEVSDFIQASLQGG